MPEVWIQLEHHAWDIAPNNTDRMTGHDMQMMTTKAPVTVPLRSPVTGAVRSRTMFWPLRRRDPVANRDVVVEALLLRRYTPNWAAPDDRKVNPWDLNEPDPTDNGTMGTIPGPVLECDVGEELVVHFRNMDLRRQDPLNASSPLLAAESRTHSLHPHGFVFATQHDGAYPLSPRDLGQPVGGEAARWATVGVTGFKQGDRVPPPDPTSPLTNNATFTYTWRTIGWPTTAGVWLYHDHSICDMDNVQLGAIGIIVIHNPADPDDVRNPPLPNNSAIGSPVRWRCFPFPFEVTALAAQLEGLGQAFREPTRHFAHVETGEAEALVARARVEISAAETHEPAPEHDVTEFVEEGGLEPGDEPGSHHHHVGEEGCEHCPECERCEDCPHCDHDEEAPVLALSLRSGSTILELNRELRLIRRLCTPIFRDPPDRAQYLLLFHNLAGDAMMCINGRKFLGNTPTIVSGENTKKRFGVVGMGNVDGFHTFHLHGHRWVIPGPEGNNPGAIQGSPQIVAVSQFEDTRTFGPANSFSFTINPGSFMRAEPGLGEWHMHCHVLTHMMDGMMGSLLVVTGGALAPPAAALQVGVPCPAMGMGAQPPGPTVVNIDIESLSFNPSTISVAAGSTVRWTNRNGPHTVTSTSVPAAAPPFDSSPLYPMNGISAAMQLNDVFQQVLTMAGTYNYFCKVHGTAMSGTVTVS